MTIRRSGAYAALLAALLLTGCAGNTGGTTDSAGSAATTPPAVTGSPDPATPLDPSLAPSGKPGGTGTDTISGTVTAGVEPNCLVLTGTSGPHLLIINDPGARSIAKVGASVTVVGKVDRRIMTTCQQGTPFVVSEVRPN